MTGIMAAMLLFSQEPAAVARKPDYIWDNDDEGVIQILTEGNEQWKPGLDYILLPQPIVRSNDIEVVVRFLYTTAVSRDLNKHLSQWEKTDLAGVRIVRRPAMKWPHSIHMGRMFHTLEELGRGDLHDAMFDWILNSPERYEIYHTVIRPDIDGMDRLNVQFAAKHGLDMRAFSDIYFSPETLDKLRVEAASSAAQGVSVTVNGRSGTDPIRLLRKGQNEYGSEENYAAFLELLKYLISAERAV